MKMNYLAVLLVCLSLLLATSALFAKAVKKEPGYYATFSIKGFQKGKIVCKLYDKDAPLTVANFIGLAQGTQSFMDPVSGNKKKGRFYNGLIFHRIIPSFMIQGGDPTGTGRGGPGYQFEDEFAIKVGDQVRVTSTITGKQELDSLVHTFNEPGMLAMANSGPGTNGSQFFITMVPTPWLNGHHTIFGEVVEGLDLVKKLSTVQRDANDKPLVSVILDKVTIEKVK